MICWTSKLLYSRWSHYIYLYTFLWQGLKSSIPFWAWQLDLQKKVLSVSLKTKEILFCQRTRQTLNSERLLPFSPDLPNLKHKFPRHTHPRCVWLFTCLINGYTIKGEKDFSPSINKDYLAKTTLWMSVFFFVYENNHFSFQAVIIPPRMEESARYKWTFNGARQDTRRGELQYPISFRVARK